MNLASCKPAATKPAAEVVDRLRGILALHLHPRHGSEYWLRRQAELEFDVCDRIRTVGDLWRLGRTNLADLRLFPVRDFIPQTFHNRLDRFVVGETAGTSGRPCATAYREDEFETAFVTPFVHVARACGFPAGLSWLWIGPSGPHVIGKAVRAIARRTGSMDPFSVDFDPRWAKRLTDGSLGRRRYLNHVVSQALDVLEREEIGVLFTTPPTLGALATKMSDRQREAIRGVHYGGLSIAAETVNEFRDRFPNAVHLAGYGNTLFGVLMEVADSHRMAMDYFPFRDRVLFEIVRAGDRSDAHLPWPAKPVVLGERGRVMFHRLDESCLLVNVLERDEAELTPPSAEAFRLGFVAGGLRDPKPPADSAGKLQHGLY
jgi:thienamycin biosynthesis protein ThnN